MMDVTGEKKKILVIEDDDSIRLLYQDLLKDEGYEVECASGGVEGLEKARKADYQLIVLDVMMPEYDGLQVLANLKKEGNKAKIALFTNLYSQEVYDEAKKIGFDDFVVKSDTNPGEMLEKVRNLIS